MINRQNEVERKMTKKTLEILVVEDDPKHLEDAKAEVDRLKGISIDIQATYATTYAEAQEAMQTRGYDGIITDIFLPFSDKQEKNAELTLECFELLKPYGVEMNEDNYRIAKRNFELYKKEWEDSGIDLDKPDDRKEFMDAIRDDRHFDGFSFLIHEASLGWKDREELAPYGVLLANQAKQQGIPVVMCTDTYHHGYKTQPIHKFASKRISSGFDRRPLIDTAGFDRYEGSAPKKDWSRAFLELRIDLG